MVVQVVNRKESVGNVDMDEGEIDRWHLKI